MNTKVKTEKLDIEWIALMIEAKKKGLNREEVRSFLNYKQSDLLPR